MHRPIRSGDGLGPKPGRSDSRVRGSQEPVRPQGLWSHHTARGHWHLCTQVTHLISSVF
jgi:hypothetical protein